MLVNRIGMKRKRGTHTIFKRGTHTIARQFKQLVLHVCYVCFELLNSRQTVSLFKERMLHECAQVIWRCTWRQESGSLTPWRREISLWGQVHRGYSHHQLSQKLHSREKSSGPLHLIRLSEEYTIHGKVESAEPIKIEKLRQCRVTRWVNPPGGPIAFSKIHQLELM